MNKHGKDLGDKVNELDKAIKVTEKIVHAVKHVASGALPLRIADAIEKLVNIQEDAVDALTNANFALKFKKDMSTKKHVDETIIAHTKTLVEASTKDLTTAGLVLKHECKGLK